MSYIELDDTELAAAIGVDLYALEALIYGEFKMSYVNFLKVKSRLIRLVKRELKDYLY